jgi:hypothetical protein
MFQPLVEKKEGLNRKIQEEIIALRQLMEATRIETVHKKT